MSNQRLTMSHDVDGKASPILLASDPAVAQSFIEARCRMVAFAQGEVFSTIEKKNFRLRISFILKMHESGFSFVDKKAGMIRSVPVVISNSAHVPPAPKNVISLLEDLCDYINESWHGGNVIRLAAYFMWRFLWIHPFNEGNGSIARLMAYSLIQIGTGAILPGSKILPERIGEHRAEYYEALSDADEAWSKGKVNVEKLESLIKQLLEEQLREWLRNSERALDVI